MRFAASDQCITSSDRLAATREGSATEIGPSPGGGLKILSFYLGGELFGISADCISEVTQPLPVTPLPNAPDNLIGISALRGQIVAVLNIKRMLCCELNESPGRSKFLVLRTAKDHIQVAFPADRMHDVISVSDVAIMRDCPLSAGTTVSMSTPSGTVRVVRPDILLQALSTH
jgi:purine-binding chemotaxis protein CheW